MEINEEAISTSSKLLIGTGQNLLPNRQDTGALCPLLYIPIKPESRKFGDVHSLEREKINNKQTKGRAHTVIIPGANI